MLVARVYKNKKEKTMVIFHCFLFNKLIKLYREKVKTIYKTVDEVTKTTTEKRIIIRGTVCCFLSIKSPLTTSITVNIINPHSFRVGTLLDALVEPKMVNVPASTV